MSAKEWNIAIRHLINGDVGDYVTSENGTVEVADMASGRYCVFDGSGFLVGITDSVWKALTYLRTGKVKCVG